VQQGITNKGPRKAIVEELRDLILKQFYTPDNYLLIGIDANESSQGKQNPSIFDMFGSLGLHVAIEHLNGEGRPPTITSSSLTIDYIFVFQNFTTTPSRSRPTEKIPHIQFRPPCNLCPTIQ